MIRGQVNGRREATIPVTVLAQDGQPVEYTAVIDTGFSGFLTLSREQIAALRLPFVETRTYALGGQRAVDFALHLATMVWDGMKRQILVLATDGGPLVGMGLLHGHRLFVDVADSGIVIVEPRN